MLLTLGMIWKAVQDPRPRRILSAGVLAILSVHAFTTIRSCSLPRAWVERPSVSHRDWKRIAYVLGIGIVAGITLAPYLGPIKRAGSWNLVFRMDFTIPWMMAKFQEAVEPAGGHVYWIWLALVPIAMLPADGSGFGDHRPPVLRRTARSSF